MAKYRGKDGVVRVGGSSVVGELKAWSLNITADVAQDAAMPDGWMTTVPTFRKWEGSATAFWDPDDTGQSALAVGAEVGLEMLPEGTDVGDASYSGSAIVTGVEPSAEGGGFVEVTFTFTGNGELAIGTVST